MSKTPNQAPTQEKIKKNSVLKSALAMSAGTLTSRILGMVRDVVLAAVFPKTITDAFLAAFKLPNMFRRILGEGALSVSFIPVYLDLKASNGEESAQELAGSLWSILMLVASLICCLAVVFMDDLFPLIIRGRGIGKGNKNQLGYYWGNIFHFSYKSNFLS